MVHYQNVRFAEVVCPGPMGHDHPSHNDGSIPSPITPTAFSSQVGNPVFHHPSEPSSSQVPIDDYDEKFGMVAPTYPVHLPHQVGSQSSFISSYSTLTGGNGVSNATNTGTISTNLESFVNPSSIYTGATLSKPYTWSPPSTWVDRFAPANPQSNLTGPQETMAFLSADMGAPVTTG